VSGAVAGCVVRRRGPTWRARGESGRGRARRRQPARRRDAPADARPSHYPRLATRQSAQSSEASPCPAPRPRSSLALSPRRHWWHPRQRGGRCADAATESHGHAPAAPPAPPCPPPADPSPRPAWPATVTGRRSRQNMAATSTSTPPPPPRPQTTRPPSRLIPPYRFATVEDGVHRGAYPVPRNYPFLQRHARGGGRVSGLGAY
jgi:hypothetical protein